MWTTYNYFNVISNVIMNVWTEATHQRHAARHLSSTRISSTPRMLAIICPASTSVTDIWLYSTTNQTRYILLMLCKLLLLAVRAADCSD